MSAFNCISLNIYNWAKFLYSLSPLSFRLSWNYFSFHARACRRRRRRRQVTFKSSRSHINSPAECMSGIMSYFFLMHAFYFKCYIKHCWPASISRRACVNAAPPHVILFKRKYFIKLAAAASTAVPVDHTAPARNKNIRVTQFQIVSFKSCALIARVMYIHFEIALRGSISYFMW